MRYYGKNTSNAKAFAFLSVLIIFLLAMVVFWPAVNYDYVSFDDLEYVADNQIVQDGLTLDGLKQAFSVFSDEYFIPVLLISYMLDAEIFGMDPRGFHLTNILIHAVNSILIFLILWYTTGAVWKSTAASLLFSLHPLRVESVAWITARKDVLSALLLFLAIGGYLKYVKTRTRAWYGFVLLMITLSLLTKPMFVSFPLLLLTLDFWPLKRSDTTILRSNKTSKLKKWRPLVVEKIPLFLVSIFFMAATLWTQRKAIHPWEGSLSLIQSLERTVTSYFIYLRKLLWPFDLHIDGHLGIPGFHPGMTIMAGSALILLTWSALRVSEKSPYAATAWFWYLAALFPVSGFVLVGSQWISDRFTYVPQLFLSVAIVWSLGNASFKRESLRKAVVAAIILIIFLLALTTRKQLPYWKSGTALFSRTIELAPASVSGHMNLGIAYGIEGDIERSEKHLQIAMNSGLGLPENAYYNYGITLLRLNRPQEAVPYFENALKINPNARNSRSQLGLAKIYSGRYEDGIMDLKIALKLDPNDRDVHYNLAFGLEKLEREDEAIYHLMENVRIDPHDHEARINLGRLLFESGRFSEARTQFLEVMRQFPNSAEYYFAKGRVLEIEGDRAGAGAAYLTGFEIDSKLPQTRSAIERAISSLGHK